MIYIVRSIGLYSAFRSFLRWIGFDLFWFFFVIFFFWVSVFFFKKCLVTCKKKKKSNAMVTACLECESGVQLIPILQMDGRIQFQPGKGLLRAHFNGQDHSLF